MKKTILNRVSLVRPGGNDTAIIWDFIPRNRQLLIAQELQIAFPKIEQVMFAELVENRIYRGQMAGGEFCGNATRALGYLLLNKLSGEISLEISGARTLLKVSVDKRGFSKTTIPIIQSFDAIIVIDHETFLVKMEGISFIVKKSVPREFAGLIVGSLTAQKRELVLQELKRFDLYKSAASGLVFVEDSNKIHPFIFVKSLDTLYYETACGSGSAAVVLTQAFEIGNSIYNKELLQPSGMKLIISVERDDSHFIGTSVDGPIKILYEGKLDLNLNASMSWQ